MRYVTKNPRKISLIIIGILVLGLSSLYTLNTTFQRVQYSKLVSKNSDSTKVDIFWPRLISSENNVKNFEGAIKDSGWIIEKHFLNFREMSDKHGQTFYLIGLADAKRYLNQSNFPDSMLCNEIVCDVVSITSVLSRTPDVSSLGLNIIGQIDASSKSLLPKSLGIEPQIPILLTPDINSLAKIEKLKYLSASFGWTITRSSNSKSTVKTFVESISRLETSLSSQFPNVAVHYQENRLEKLLENESNFVSHIRDASYFFIVLTLVILFLLWSFEAKTILPQSLNRISLFSFLFIFSFISFLLLRLWSLSTLIQSIAFSLISIISIHLILISMDKWLLRNDFDSLTFFRSSLKYIFNLNLSLVLLFAIIFSGVQYHTRNEDTKAKIIDRSVPLDASLKIGSSLDRPLDLGSIDQIKSFSKDISVEPVIRNTATVIDSSGESSEVNLIAVGRSMDWQEPQLPLPAGKELRIQSQGIPKNIDLIVWLRTDFGGHLSLQTTGYAERTATLPTENQFSIVAFELRVNPDYASRREHALAESTGRSFDDLSGIGNIEKIAVDSHQVAFDKSWQISRFSFSLAENSLIIRPKPIIPDEQVLISSDIQLDSQSFNLSGLTKNTIEITRYTATNYFPGAEKPFVILSLPTYQALLATSNPGSIDPLELWIKAPAINSLKTALANSPFAKLKFTSRQDLQNQQKNSTYWNFWDLNFLIVMIISLLLILVLILYSCAHSFFDFKKKSNELVSYFGRNKVRVLPLLIISVFSIMISIPVLYVSRLIAGILT